MPHTISLYITKIRLSNIIYEEGEEGEESKRLFSAKYQYNNTLQKVIPTSTLITANEHHIAHFCVLLSPPVGLKAFIYAASLSIIATRFTPAAHLYI